MPAKAHLASLIASARAQRDAGAWAAAARLYAAANDIDSSLYDVKHNLALCHLGKGSFDETLQFTAQALALKPDLWQSHLLRAKVHRARGDVERADDALTHVLKYDPSNGTALLAMADLDMNEYGDAVGARERVAPLLRVEQHRADAELTTLMSKLYDRDETDQELSDALMDFARRELVMPGFSYSPEAQAGVPNRTGRKRVGLLSPLFCVSPVYFFTIAAFRAMAQKCDLVILNRGTREDWATQAFRDIAYEWHNVQNLASPELANAIKRQNIDVLFDLGGWMDPAGLKALSVKPARKMYKWVGGQSATTGLTTFDGFITDDAQSPPGSERLHSEPLIRIPGGYVTYTPPPYMPEPLKGPRQGVAVVGNPAKISGAMLNALLKQDIEINFIDRRYKFAKTRNRIQGKFKYQQNFVTPRNHLEYLKTITQYDNFLDSSPYNCGLTCVEILTLGLSITEFTGSIFSSRHSMSHKITFINEM
jgi:predicted O-linked N-acetylglucosamine transferase (SPINDLY family)